MRAFKSTPNFIQALTEISLQVLVAEEKKPSLLAGLAEINKHLPASVYIPFVNSAWRNYCVLNIVENESKLFLTKTKAPFLVCIEVYRPEEVLLTSQKRFSQLLINDTSKLNRKNMTPLSASGHTQLPSMLITNKS